MTGRQTLGAVAVERRVLLFAVVAVAVHPLGEGRTVAGTARPRRPAGDRPRDTAPPGDRRPDLASGPREGAASGLAPVGELPPDYVLKPEDRVVIAATRRDLAELRGRAGARARRR
ncbi:hypothetical protein AMK16_02470 [Streptomyces sp. CB00455]|uniref:hypothetical protein n=1 Tax=Streptomyces sp. CB00455 TaxID=1703927 RepID=UPI00093B67FB|nr:hypothetical protein [Streptomyces sp. CB00455]OKK22098.1 hypothetical protein AMK16_02470 [Streptomyces sp. CB00455]